MIAGRRAGLRPARLAATVTLVACCGAGAWAQEDDEPRLPPGSEGPLANDVFLPVHPTAGTRLAEGDAALARARSARNQEDRRRLLLEAFDAWHGVLAPPASDAPAAAAPMDALFLDDPSVAARRVALGREPAVHHRLAGLTDAERALWHERVEGTAAAQLARAGGREAALAALEREHPGTSSAVRAALLLGDRALERGDLVAARAWLARGRASLVGLPEPALHAALERRERTATEWQRSAGAADAGRWRVAAELEPVAALPLDPEAARLAPRRAAPPTARDDGLHPGLTFLPDGRVAVQRPQDVRLFRFDPQGGLEHAGAFAPEDLVSDAERIPELVHQTPVPEPGWPLLPAATPDGDLVLVVGRSDHLWNNALLCVRPPQRRASVGPAERILDPEALPRLRWAWVGDRALDAEARPRGEPDLVADEGLEFQPGPVVVGDLVVVQARVYAGSVQAWLFAFDRERGTLRWRRLLATGSDLAEGIDRMRTGDVPRLAAEPLASRDGLVFAGTHLGSGSLVEALDGRLRWSVKCRRRPARSPGWSRSRTSFGPEPGDGPTTAVLWAPFDSDRAYALALEPVPSPLAWPPRARGEARTLLGGSPQALVVQGRAGPEWTVSELGATGTDRRDALYLGPEESFVGRGLTSPSRVLVGTDRGVYLFDRERDLYLLDYAPLPELVPRTEVAAGERGGDLYASGEHVLVLGRTALQAFRAR